MNENVSEPDESVALINAELTDMYEATDMKKTDMTDEQWSTVKANLQEEREEIFLNPFPEGWYESIPEVRGLEKHLGYIIRDVEYLKNLVTSLESSQDVIEQYCIIQKISTALMEECSTKDAAINATANRIQFLTKAINRMANHLKSTNAQKEAM